MIKGFKISLAATIGLWSCAAAAQDSAPDSSVAVGGTAAGRGLLPEDLSPWAMFLHSDMVVKAVMVGLAIASIVTWTVWLAKTLELLTAARRLRRTAAAVADAPSLSAAAERATAAPGVLRAMLGAAEDEWERSADGLDDHDGLKERIASHLERAEANAARAIARGTGILATIGATAPFVGLFGTVWGIMNSFIGISQAHTTNLAVVAPGIAEALLATACGLVAAIPAVVIYNHFSRQIAAYRAAVADTAAGIMRLVSRDLSCGGHSRPAKAKVG